MKRLVREDIRLGVPLPYSVYDPRGALLLRKGFVISYEEQLLRLLERGIYFNEEQDGADRDEAKKPNVFNLIGAASLRLKALLNDIKSPDPSVDVVNRLEALARDLLQATRGDPDMAIAAVHMDFHNLYILAHLVHAAVLCALLAPRLDLDGRETHSLLCAALSFDIGMLDLLHLEKQKHPLDPDQRAALAKHADRSGEILSKAGVSDPRWLETVRQHHERLDGKGYPNGRSGGDIAPLAGVLGVVDVYLAMIKPRAWRQAAVPLAALKETYAMKDTALPGNACNALIKELGMYPPGSIVRLHNNEIAVVGKRGADIQKPLVHSLYEASGIPRMTAVARDTHDSVHAIKCALSHRECRSASLLIARLWSGR